MVLDTQDVAEYGRSHARGLRLTFWLFKTDQVCYTCWQQVCMSCFLILTFLYLCMILC